jgi:hypothetical protein
MNLRRSSLVLLSLVSATVGQTPMITLTGNVPDGQMGIGVAGLGDVDGDGVPDFAVATPPLSTVGTTTYGSVALHSGFDGSVLWTVSGTSTVNSFGHDVTDAGDYDGDGIRDVASAGAPLRILSGATGTTLATLGIFVNFIRSGGDFDGDGLPDFLSRSGVSFDLHSGATGATLLSVSSSPLIGTAHGTFVKDLNGDGYDELLIAILGGPFTPPSGFVYLLLGPSTSPVAGIGGAASPFGGFPVIPPPFPGKAVADAGDLDGDGVHDLVVGFVLPSEFRAYSGGTWNLLWSVPGGMAGDGIDCLRPVGDVTGDGVPDLAVATPNVPVGFGFNAAGLSILSGADGSLAWSVGGGATDHIGRVAAAGDVNLDGRADVILGVPAHDAGGVDAGRVVVYSGTPLAAATVLDLLGACGATTPALSSTLPVIGSSVTLGVTGLPPSGVANLVLDLAVDVPTALGAGCTFHLDPSHIASWIFVPLAVNGAGAATTMVGVPSIPTLVGFTTAMQVFAFDAAAPLGFDLSNGVRATLGY